ncbi:MAG: MarR family transcriptional regulator [Richelia sp. CSU_2_1]|nr:MarR family transcriptional regulator [Microcoleus sp. SU_5_6]NJL69160.1 MarR family transcriptional regulator [Microcoleus sp. SM1_3_4]NJR23154.1 MarR family transcriptional regulator [Richelia sp. CSU_2_1]
MTGKPQLDNLRNSVWRLFITANVKLLDRIGDKFSQAGLPSMDWYDVLLTLKEAPEYRLRLSDLAEKTLLSRSNLTHLVDRLEKAGLLDRERCPSDRRGTYAVLTEAGLAMQQQMWAVYSEGIAQYFGCHLSDEELEVMQRVLERMLKAVCE